MYSKTCGSCGKPFETTIPHAMVCSKECRAEFSRSNARKWYASNKERAREKGREWRANNPDYLRRWREDNPLRVEAHNKTSNESNPGKGKEYRRKHREECLIRDRAYSKANRDRINKASATYRENNKESIREKAKARSAAITDSYAANALKIPVALCPQPLLEFKREHLKLKRLLKEIKNEAS